MAGNILIRVGAETAEAIAKLRGIESPLSDVQSRGEKMGGAIRKATLPAIGVLGALAVAGKGAAQAAAEDEAAHVKLVGALERTTGATAAQVSAAEDYISKLELSTGVADDQLRPALAKLASATGDVGTAQSQLSLALDISAQSGKGLDVVTKALAAANDGHTASLQKLVPGLDAATLKSKDMTAITAALADKVGGAASEAANTATGRYRVMQVQMGELQEDLGTLLIPVISAMSAALLKATTFVRDHTTTAKVLIGVVALLAGGILAANVALKAYEAAQILVRGVTAAWTAAQWLLNAALTANPIGVVVVAIAALAAGIVLAYQHSATFRRAVQAAWDVLKASPIAEVIGLVNQLVDAVQTLIGWIGRIHWPSPPGWLSKVGGILGAVVPGSAPAFVSSSSARSSGSSARSSSSPRSAGASSLLSTAAGGIVVNFFGDVTDPEGTARAIRRNLRGHVRRQGALLGLGGATS